MDAGLPQTLTGCRRCSTPDRPDRPSSSCRIPARATATRGRAPTGRLAEGFDLGQMSVEALGTAGDGCLAWSVPSMPRPQKSGVD